MCTYHKPVCVSCQLEYEPEKNGVALLDYASFGPYKLWEADKWKCKGCGHEIITGFTKQAYSEHYKSGFQDTIGICKLNNNLYPCYENQTQKDLHERVHQEN